MPTLRCVILPPLKLALRLSQVCHNLPLTLNTKRPKAPKLELKPNFYKHSGAILLLISFWNWTQGLVPVTLKIKTEGQFAPSSRTETQFDKGSYPKIQVRATQHWFFINDLWFSGFVDGLWFFNIFKIKATSSFKVFAKFQRTAWFSPKNQQFRV
jgi:hypothetical protein